jgi:hypothetical protein
MPIPPTAIAIEEGLDPQAIKNFRVLATDALENAETIDPANWSLTPLPAALALGFEVIESDATYPDPTLDGSGVAVDFWARVDPLFAGDPAFEGAGTAVPFEFTYLTTGSPPKKEQQTFTITLVEK